MRLPLFECKLQIQDHESPDAVTVRNCVGLMKLRTSTVSPLVLNLILVSCYHMTSLCTRSMSSLGAMMGISDKPYEPRLAKKNPKPPPKRCKQCRITEKCASGAG